MLPILRIIPVGGVLLAIAILILALNPPGAPHMHFTSVMVAPRGALISRDEHPEWRQFLILAALRRADELQKLRELPDAPLRAEPRERRDIIQLEQQKKQQKIQQGEQQNKQQKKQQSEQQKIQQSEQEKEQQKIQQGEQQKKQQKIQQGEQQNIQQQQEQQQQEQQQQADKAAGANELAAVQPSHPDRADVTGTAQSSGATIPVDIGESSSTELPVVPHEEQPPVIRMPELDKPQHESSAAPEPAQPTPQSQPAAAPEPTASKQASPQAAAAAAAAEPKPETPTVTPEPAQAKPASRDVAPEPSKPKREIALSVRERFRREVRAERIDRHARLARDEATPAPAQVSLFQVLFGDPNGRQPRGGTQMIGIPRHPAFGLSTQ